MLALFIAFGGVLVAGLTAVVSMVQEAEGQGRPSRILVTPEGGGKLILVTPGEGQESVEIRQSP